MNYVLSNLVEAGLIRAKRFKNSKNKIAYMYILTFNELVKIMVDADMGLIGLAPPGEGKKVGHEKGIGWTENKQTIRIETKGSNLKTESHGILG